MTDYWKSNPRKFCEICKCWFGDNQPSINFHEQGKRHKDNVQRQLKDARIKSVEKEKENEKNARTLASIEQAALQAYQKDLESKYGGLPSAQAREPLTEDQLQQIKYDEIASTLQAQKDRELEKGTIQEKIQKKVQEIKQESNTDLSWQQLLSPEGYVYYYNTVTGVSQWEAPPSFQPFQTQPTSTAGEVQEGDSHSNGSSSLAGQKRPIENEESSPNHKASKRSHQSGPYGSWQTVAVHERQEPVEPEESEVSLDTKTLEKKKKVMMFEEKTIRTQGLNTDEEAPLTQSSVKFSFKKRGNTRPHIRQRTSELS